jgi:Tfp pilus assembly major pilin PilA
MNRHRQRGVTALGWLVILAIIGIFAIAALRLLPIYLEYFRVSSVLTSLRAEKATGVEGKGEIRQYIEKRFDIDAINRLKVSDILVTAENDNYVVRAKYDARTPFIGNVDFILSFDKSVEVPR